MSQRRWTGKYRNRKCEYKGIHFPSKRERDRFIILEDMQAKGEISELRCQVKFELLEHQKLDGKVVERAVDYIADFTYRDADGNLVVEDAKGFKTPEYVIKRKLLLHKYGIRIMEV